jgi:Ca2+-binding EF-hand superfamily protein
MIKGKKVSPEQLFNYFDKTGAGKLTSSQFFQALEKVGISDLTGEEKERLLRSIDFNNDGWIDLNEFKRKLSRAGV